MQRWGRCEFFFLQIEGTFLAGEVAGVKGNTEYHMRTENGLLFGPSKKDLLEES